MADYLPPVVAKLTGDDSNLGTTLDAALVKVKKFAADAGKTKATISVDAKLRDGTLAALRTEVKDSPAAKFNAELQLKTGTLTALRTTIKNSAAAKLDITATLKAGALAAVRQDVKDAPAAKLDVDLRLKDGALTALRTKVKDSAAAKLNVQLKLDSTQAAGIRTTLEANGVELKVKPKMDQVAQRRVAVVLMELGKRVDVLVRPTLDQQAQARTEARLARLTRDRTVTIRTITIGGDGSGSDSGGGGILRALIPLAPAVVPVAASLTASALSVVASMGSAAAAVGVFGLAAYSEVKQLGAMSDALETLTSAQNSNAASSQKAVEDQQKALSILESAPQATKQAAAAYGDLRNAFTKWSDSMSGFTMEPVEKSFAVAESILPKLSPMVEGTSTQLNRLMTIAGGAVSTPGFDSMMTKFSNFADGALSRGIDDLVHFSRLLNEGDAKGPIADFMQYAEKEGPEVRATLENIAKAVDNLLKGAAEAGPGLLSLVNDAAKLVAALPPEFIARAMELYTAFKLIGLTRSGVTAVDGAMTGLASRLTVLRTASAGAGGGIAGVRAALATLSTGTKVAGAIAVVAGVVMVMKQLSDSGKKAPDVDKMTTAVGNFGRTGKVSGEMARVFGTDMDGLGKAIDRVSGQASGMDKFNDTMNKIFSLGMAQSNSMKAAKGQIDSIDKGLASLVSSGHADLAAAAIDRFAKSGNALPKNKLDDYTSALADAAFESNLVADSQGMFGAQAQQVQKQLDAQKESADGLRQSLQALNDVNRAGLSAESDFEQALDDATKAIKGHHNALKMVHGQLDLNTQAARDAYKPLSDLAEKTDADAAAARDQGKSWSTVYGIYDRGRAKIIATADAMGLSTKNAKALADQILRTPDKTATLKGDLSDLQKKLAQAKRDLDNAPKSQQTKLKGDVSDLSAKVRLAERQLALLGDKTVHVSVVTTHTSTGVAAHEGGGYATGAMTSGGVRRMAEGGFGRPAMMARGGANVLWAEGGDESYIPHDRRPRSKAIAEKTVGIMGGSVSWGSGPGAGSGGSAAAAAEPIGMQVAKGLWAGMDGQAAWLAAQTKAFATKTIPVPMADALGINSPSKVAMSLGRWVGAGMVQGLTGSTASVKSATLRLSRSIQQVFHDDAQSQLAADKKNLAKLAGTKGHKAASERAGLRSDIRQQQGNLNKDSAVSRFVAVDNSRLLKLASERDSVAGKLKAAQSKLTALQASWTSEKNSISSSIMSGASVITDSPDAARGVNANDVIKQMQDQVAKAKQFAAELDQLKKKGLRSDIIEQIASAGVDQGGATALALAGGTAGQIQQLNNLQGGLKYAADKTGTTVANSMYGAGIASAKGLIKGLQSQEKAIDAQMLKIAKSMEKEIKQALGIRSPSTVMATLGDHTAVGYALGVQRSTKHAIVAAQGMAMATRQAASITGFGPARYGAAITGAPAGGGDTHVHYHAHVSVEGSVVTDRQLTDVVQTGLYRVATRNPDTYPKFTR